MSSNPPFTRATVLIRLRPDGSKSPPGTALRVPAGDSGVTTLSGGERRRVALCRVLLEAPDMLLLDEPTNHLDIESIQWLEEYLSTYPGSVLIVSHDRTFLDKLTNRTIEINNGNIYDYIAVYVDAYG